jgi:hypothetical protein
MQNALLRVGNKNDREDARKLSELLFLNKLHPVYHGETGIRTLKELARSYLTITRDLTRVMNRPKAIYRGWGIACAGQQWLAKITEAGVRRRAEIYYQQFDVLAALRQEVRRDLLAESRKHPAMRLLRQIPSIGPIRAALLIALMQTPHRFRTKRQLWAYCGLALRTYDGGEYRFSKVFGHIVGWRSDKWSEIGSSIGAVPVFRTLNSTWKGSAGFDVRWRNAQQIDSQSMRVALVGSAISDAAAAVTSPSAMRVIFTICLRCWRVPKFRARTNVRDVDVLHFLGCEETRPSEHK